MRETLVLATGVIGSSILLAASIINFATKHASETFFYNLLNAIGGILLVSYAYMIASIPFMVIEFAWSVLSLAKIQRLHHTRLSIGIRRKR